MALDSGLTVFVCSIFFVFLALLKQNVLIFVSNNLGNHSSNPGNPQHRALFRAYDLDHNGVIDSDEFDLIAKRLLPPINDSVGLEAELDVVYVDINVMYSGSAHLPRVDKSIVYPAKVLSLFIPSSAVLGHKWLLHESSRGSAASYFSYPIHPSEPHYTLYQLLGQVHWNVMFNTRLGPAISSAIVSAISDSHLRVNFVISAEYQLSQPPDPTSWLEPCQTENSRNCPLDACQTEPSQFQGEAVITLDLQIVTYFVIGCGDQLGDVTGNKSDTDTIRISSVGSFYQYKIQHNKLVAVPLGPAVEKMVSYHWYDEITDWRDVLNRTQF